MAISKGLKNVRWPGRLENVQEKPWILLDGAHNPDAIRAGSSYLKEKLKGRRLKVLFGAMADKDLNGMLTEIAPITDRFVFTAPEMRRAASPNVLAELASVYGKRSEVIDGAKAVGAHRARGEAANPRQAAST